MIRANIQLETRLIDDLLDLTRIAQGKLELNEAPLDVHAVLLVRSIFVGQTSKRSSRN